MYPSTKNQLDYLQQIVFVEKPEFVCQPEYPLSLALQARVQEITQSSIAQDLPVRYAFTMPLFTGHMVIPGPQVDWAFMPLNEDPLFLDQPYGYPVPSAILTELHRIVNTGMEFDDLYIAHELPKGVIEQGQRATLEMLAPPPSKRLQRNANCYASVAQFAYQAVTLPLAGAAAIAGAGIALGAVAAIGAVSAVPLVIGSLATLDPVLFGVVKDPVHPLHPAAWFYLANWAYDGE